MGGQLVGEPAALGAHRTASTDLCAAGVQDDDARRAGVVGIPGRVACPRRRAEVAPVTRRSGGAPVVVPGGRPRPIKKGAPRRLVAPAEVLGGAGRIGVVARGEDDRRGRSRGLHEARREGGPTLGSQRRCRRPRRGSPGWRPRRPRARPTSRASSTVRGSRARPRRPTGGAGLPPPDAPPQAATAGRTRPRQRSPRRTGGGRSRPAPVPADHVVSRPRWPPSGPRAPGGATRARSGRSGPGGPPSRSPSAGRTGRRASGPGWPGSRPWSPGSMSGA